MKISKKNWVTTTFGEVAIQQKTDIDRNSDTVDRYIAGEHMNSEDLHIRHWGVFNGQYLGPAFRRKFEKDDILYGSRRTYLKKVAVADFAGITANTTFVIKANEERIWPRLLPFLMLSDSFTEHSVKHSKGSVNPYINWKDIANYEFKLPPSLDDQKSIADLLWSIDETIESYDEILKRLSVTYLIELKNIATIKGNEKRVGDVAHLHYGDGLREKDRHDGPYLVVGSSGVVGKHIECRVQGPGIVVGRKGSAGEVLWIDTDFWPIDTTYYVEIKSPKDMDLEYFYYVLKSLDLPSLTITTAVPGLNRDDVLLKTIKVPGLSVQAKVVERFRSIQLVKEKVNSHILHTKNIQKQIINQMFG